MSQTLHDAVEEVRELEAILVIAPTPFFGDRGSHVRIHEEIQLLKELGYCVEVCAFPRGRDVDGVRIHRCANIPLPRFLQHVLLLGTCFRVIRTARPCLVHAHLHGGAVIGGILGRLFRIPCVADLPGSLTREFAASGFARGNPLVYRLLHRVERWIDRLPDHIVASSKSMADDFSDRFDVPAECVALVRDGVARGYPGEAEPDARERYGIPRDHQVVVTLGVLTGRPGVDALVETMARVVHARHDVSFVVVGFPGEARLRAAFARSRHRDRVVFTGRMGSRTVARLLAMADLAIAPELSETEGTGRLIEFMACGLPTIVFDTPVNREVLGELGLYVKARTAAAFASKLLGALAAKEQVRRLGPELRQRATQRAPWDSNRRVLADVYGRIRGAAAR